MIKIAIVEDEEEAFRSLQSVLERWSEESGQRTEIVSFQNAFDFLETDSKFDLVFMDIELPHMDGMEAAKKLRERDSVVLIVFITNMQQYAIEGYSVSALDFILKPIGYRALKSLMEKVVRILMKRDGRAITVKSAGGTRRVEISSIEYVEVFKHKLTFHTIEGNFDAWGTLTELEKMPEFCDFARCNSCYLVNLQYVNSIYGEEITVGGETLKMSRLRKKDFMEIFAKYLGGK